MQYRTDFITEGRGGLAYYTEDEKSLSFDWDITSVGFEIYVPSPSEWDEFCEQSDFSQCRGRREEILQRLAEEIRKKKAKTAKVTIDDHGISFSFERDWLHSLLSRILGG